MEDITDINRELKYNKDEKRSIPHWFELVHLRIKKFIEYEIPGDQMRGGLQCMKQCMRRSMVGLCRKLVMMMFYNYPGTGAQCGL